MEVWQYTQSKQSELDARNDNYMKVRTLMDWWWRTWLPFDKAQIAHSRFAPETNKLSNLACKYVTGKGKLGANAMNVAAGAHLPNPWLFEPAERPDDRADWLLAGVQFSEIRYIMVRHIGVRYTGVRYIRVCYIGIRYIRIRIRYNGVRYQVSFYQVSLYRSSLYRNSLYRGSLYRGFTAMTYLLCVVRTQLLLHRWQKIRPHDRQWCCNEKKLNWIEIQK